MMVDRICRHGVGWLCQICNREKEEVRSRETANALVEMYDHSGRPDGHAEIPFEVLRAASMVHDWMNTHDCESLSLSGLHLEKKK